MDHPVVAWLGKDPRYAHAIARLAGLKSAKAGTPGTPVQVAAWWDGEKFTAPIQVTFHRGRGAVRWHFAWEPRIFTLTLKKLEESFKEMGIPPQVVGVNVIVAQHRKKPYFVSFAFNTPMQEGVVLDGMHWERPEELEALGKDLGRTLRWLKGVGLD